jgi:dimethylamine monooxygenase subunit C
VREVRASGGDIFRQMMTKTVFPPSIKSRPVYGVLGPRVGTHHLVIADGEGGEAITDLMAKSPEPAAMLAAMHILYAPGPNGTDQTAALQSLGATQFYRAPTIAAMLPRLARVLLDAHMGTQFYLTGTEGLMGQAEREIMATGFPHTAIQKEHRGSTVRRVQCVHCKGITENVRLDPFPCSHCGLNLFVRDHYSRRIAAFQGVNIDAEDPGIVSPAVERFT